MKKLFITALAFVLVGCSMTGLESGEPIFKGHSLKSPEQINKCLAPKWIALRSSSTSIPTAEGYQISSSDDWFGALSLVTIKNSATNGSDIKVYAAAKGWNDPWGEATRSCM